METDTDLIRRGIGFILIVNALIPNLKYWQNMGLGLGLVLVL